MLIETTRGAVVDEPASTPYRPAVRQIAAAGLDVFATEPLPPNHELRNMDNVVLSPATNETLRRGLPAATGNCRPLCSGRWLMHGGA
jgi:phosphoglycerate dehydrogenase-like enzyme